MKTINLFKGSIKKLIVLVLAVAVVVAAAPANSQAASKGYQFTYKGVTVYMGAPAAKLLKKAGKPIKTKVEKSCAYKGKDRTYQYKDFILYTYSNTDNGPQYVGEITFLTSSVKTKEGIKFGSTLAQVKKKYGSAKNNLGVYSYTKGNCKLMFEILNNKVTNVKYVKKSVK